MGFQCGHVSLCWERVPHHSRLRRRGLFRRRWWLGRVLGSLSRLPHMTHLRSKGTLVSVMTIYATKSTRVDGFNSVPLLAFVIISPLGVLVALVLIAPNGLMLWGLIPALARIVMLKNNRLKSPRILCSILSTEISLFHQGKYISTN